MEDNNLEKSNLVCNISSPPQKERFVNQHFFSDLKFKLHQFQKNTFKLKKKQDKKDSSSKMEAMCHFAGAFAHEISQPLAAITSYSQSCLFVLNNKSILYHRKYEKLLCMLQQIVLQAEHAGNMMHDMDYFMRNDHFYTEETDLNELIRETLFILEYELLEAELNITLNLMEKLPKVRINRTHIMQVILNLARNSMESVAEAQEVKSEIQIITQQADDFIVVHFMDNGLGVPSQFHEQIFKAYFTTKRQGTGLGLNVCRILIEAHGGKLSVQHQAKGAWFTFTLPIHGNS